ncbi:bifunctional diguanylate cyclase/phosphodiesterase [Cloacibacillus evryensis]|uniref:bifunctional diguanylate cyclase/phosphodiesterase n=1 Tax=Cloacibacillus evryensis TaxID=508460 RepID=UPI00241F6DB8|nr:EAL domain-containing protein [Cloacibacillus evryensis]
MMIHNAVELRRSINDLTETYLSDVADEASRSVNNRLAEIFGSMRIIASSIPHLKEAERGPFLAEKAEISDFINMGIVGDDGIVHFIYGESYNIKNNPLFTSSLDKDFRAGTEGKDIFYIAPIPGGDRDSRALVAVKTKRDMQELIAGNFFGGEGSTTILNQKGDLIVPPLKKKHSELIRKSNYQGTEDWAVRMLDDLGKNRQGRFILPTVSGRGIYIDYRPLAINGWFLAIAVPTDIIASHAEIFIARTFHEYEGRMYGDGLLRKVYDILNAEAAKAGEMAARGNAATFYMLMENTAAEKLLKRLKGIADKIEKLGDSMGPIRVDVGIFFPSDEPMTAEEAEVCADTARKSAERSYLSTFTFYDEEFKHKQHEAVCMLNDIERAIEEKKLTIYLQPKVCTRTGRVAGAEALVRWKHPKLGFVSPSVFIPLCEKNGIIARLDLMVFREVCEVLSGWKEAGMPLLPISVNLSRQHLKNPSFFADYKKTADAAGIDPKFIEFELTESLMLEGNDFKNARQVLSEIHKAGFTCSLDDFGSGYSSFGLLKDLHIDCLKLDGIFFVNRFETPETKAVIESIVSLAKKLNIRTVAEGVEYKEQADFLRSVGCDLIQGFYYYRAVPVKEFERIILEDRNKSAGGK